MNFTDGAQYIDLQMSSIPAPWTASVWVKRQASPNTFAIITQSSEGSIGLEQWNNTKKVGISRSGDYDYTFDYTAPVDAWVQLVFVAKAGSTTLYVNGLETASMNQVIGLPLTSLGTDNGGTMIGELDEVAVWNRSLNSAEISKLYTFGSQGQPVNYIGQYALDVTNGSGDGSYAENVPNGCSFCCLR